MRGSHAIPAARTCTWIRWWNCCARSRTSIQPHHKVWGQHMGRQRIKRMQIGFFSEYHGMVWVGKEGTSESHPVQHPCNEQGQLQIHQVEILHISKNGASTTSLRNLCQCLITLTIKIFFLISKSIFNSFI